MLSSRSSKWSARSPELVAKEVRKRPSVFSKKSSKSKRNLTARRTPFKSFQSLTNSLKMSAETLRGPSRRSRINAVLFQVRSRNSNLKTRWLMEISTRFSRARKRL